MFDFFESLLQGLSDHFGRITCILRKHVSYRSIVMSSSLVDENIANNLLGHIPKRTATCLIQFVDNKNQWEILYIDINFKYIGNRWPNSREIEMLSELDKGIIYKCKPPVTPVIES